MASGLALGILVVALLGTGGGIGAYAIANGVMGGTTSGTTPCGTRSAACGSDATTCLQNMNAGADPESRFMGMTPEQCQTMHASMSGTMMPGGPSPGSCH